MLATSCKVKQKSNTLIMIHSTYHNKSTNEDPKTSAVFETMLMLPDEVFWEVLRGACLDNSNLPPVAGGIVEYQFWPHWDPTHTTNTSFVEPDVFIRFQLFDVIIEAKYGEKSGQYAQQWKNEIIAYRNEYGNGKPIYFMAVGGNADKASESLSLTEDVIINKCTWLSLLIQITKLRDEYRASPMIANNHSSLIRLLNLIELAFNIHGVYNIKWFDDIKASKPLISPDSILTLKTYFK